ncbi:uncharacterized protein LOC129786200 [Lutzomyia longipalpis]|uniref:uncharacterized protein LOC129786200 n=1 Tax=Lutzomyia longipalpis TaxID=7200 RepID=UPI002483A447|nr:uncharacterized protein LOC129786200 [Lutzomyia longipalpis]
MNGGVKKPELREYNDEDQLYRVLRMFLEPGIRISNDVYLEMLITHLSGKNKNASDCTRFLKSPKILNWIDRALDQWSTKGLPDHHIVGFTLRLLTLYIEDPKNFTSAREKLIFDRIHDIINHPSTTQTPSIQLANVILLAAIAKHNDGLVWIKEKRAWLITVDYCHTDRTVYVVREALLFIHSIIGKLCFSEDRKTCIEIFEEICKPLEEIKKKTDQSPIVSVDDSDMQKFVTPTLHILGYILYKTIKENECGKISKYIIETCQLEGSLWRLASVTHNHRFLGKLMRIFVLLNFAQVQVRRSEHGHDEENFNEFGMRFFNCMNFCITRRSGSNILMMTELSHMLWKSLNPAPPIEVAMENQKIQFEDQFIVLQIMPVIFKIRKRREDTACLDQYIMKLLNVSSEHTIRLCYAFRDLMLTVESETVTDFACKSIQSILGMKEVLTRERAVIVFQALIYCLYSEEPDVNGCNLDRPNIISTELLVKSPNLLSYVLTGLHGLVKEYKITWKECLESTIVINFMLALLEDPNLSSRHVVQALQLTQLSIEHFLAPNLALLVDTLKGSAMEGLGKMIFKKLHDNSWEIRDSTLELLSAMVIISEQKFPAFLQHILDSKLCPIVGSMAKNDMEPYVRATALHCMYKMMNIPGYWEKSLNSLDLVSHLLVCLSEESEGVVRREAVCLLCSLYDHQKVPKNQLDAVLSTMAHCAVNDLHWEVKINGLLFWRNVIQRQCQHQGVIDGVFPSVTFSKENKKIVMLNEREISLRIGRILDELSVRGCLGVLMECLKDDCDLAVVKVAVEIIENLKTFLSKYNYLEGKKRLEEESRRDEHPVIDVPYQKPPAKPEGSNNLERNNADVCPASNSDVVIESILDASDVNLLAIAYENQMSVNGHEEEAPKRSTINPELYREFAKVTPNQFLSTLQEVNLNELVRAKSEWISQTESFSSLLDDILLSFKDIKVNDADCY